ncbi:MAG: TIGR04283 family arsenosugar biosynthesis glycosyltransferase [Desulfobacterales bacterium]|jgi:rSAM/selenodomain-associated transferase 2/rSAM/selenodomain-associated transferase 1
MAAVMPERLIVFTRFPEPGKTKTRLIPALGAEGAARLQRQMTEHILAIVTKVSDRPGLTIEVRHEGGNTGLMQEWLGPQYSYRPQGPGDLGRRMARAFEAAFRKSKGTAVIVGSDIPGISANIIQQAFEALQKNDLVLGPAHDGGYYLIGMKNTLPAAISARLFEGIDWGTGEVFSQTLEAARESGLCFIVLESLGDVDRPVDLHNWQEVKKATAKPSSAQKISIIIPTLNEAAAIVRTLSHLEGVENLEVIVVDGGSIDETAGLAGSRGAKVIQSNPGKAVQMNTGAAAATGDIIVFLHADTLLPEEFGPQIVSALKKDGVAAGAFRLAIDSTGAGIRIIEGMTNLRSRLLRLPYGDQALFMKKSQFEKIGGFPELPIMEDFILIRRLKRRGKIAIVPAAVVTSPRRWLHMGLLKTWLINQLIIIAYYLGTPPERLNRWYRREAGKKGN